MNERLLWIAPLILLIGTAFVTWILSRGVPTRRLGYGAVLATIAAFGCLVAARFSQPEGLDIAGRPWIVAYSNLVEPVSQARLDLRLDGLSFTFMGGVLAGASLGLLMLAQSLGSSLKGYGQLWSALLIMVSGVVIAIAAADLLVFGFGWGVALLGTALARRVVGSDETRAPDSLVLAGPGALALLAGIVGIVVRPNDPTSGSFAYSDLTATISLATWASFVIASMAALALPPFSRLATHDDGAPPLLHAFVLALGMPVLGIYMLLRLLGLTLGRWPNTWLIVLGVLGALALIGGIASALRATRFGPLLGAQAVGHWGLTLLVLSRYNPDRALDDPANTVVVLATLVLALNTMWTTLLSGMAAGAYERRTGSDHLNSQPVLGRPLRAAGFAYGLGAATALGLPPMTGYWARRALLETTDAAFLLPALFGGSLLLGLTYLGPLALFWRRGAGGDMQATGGKEYVPVLLLATAPYLVGIIAPQLVAEVLLEPAIGVIQPITVITTPIYDQPLATRLIGGGIVLLVGLLVAQSGRGPAPTAWTGGEALDPDPGAPLVPQAFGHSLRAFAALSAPERIGGLIGSGLERAGAGLAWASTIVSGRYYLTGILIAALTLMLLLVQ